MCNKIVTLLKINVPPCQINVPPCQINDANPTRVMRTLLSRNLKARSTRALTTATATMCMLLNGRLVMLHGSLMA